MRRSIDDHPFRLDELPPSEEDIQHLSWAVAISDDYDDAEPRGELLGEPDLLVGPNLLEADHVGVEAGQGGCDRGSARLPWPEAMPQVPGQDPQPGLDQRSVGPVGVRHGFSIAHPNVSLLSVNLR